MSMKFLRKCPICGKNLFYFYKKNCNKTKKNNQNYASCSFFLRLPKSEETCKKYLMEMKEKLSQEIIHKRRKF